MPNADSAILTGKVRVLTYVVLAVVTPTSIGTVAFEGATVNLALSMILTRFSVQIAGTHYKIAKI